MSDPAILDATAARVARHTQIVLIKVGKAGLLRLGGAAKRAIDVTVSASMLLALAPLFVLVAAAIRFTDGGTVLYVQTRVGRRGQEFPFPKFRSMVAGGDRLKDTLLQQNDHGHSVTFKMRDDPRVTRIGRIIRRLSIDELPQLWCVLWGHMSLVGPRPPIPREVREYSQYDRRRLDAIPGLTCIWQVRGRGRIPFPQQVELDVAYSAPRGSGVALGPLPRPLPGVLGGRGAY